MCRSSQENGIHAQRLAAQYQVEAPRLVADRARGSLSQSDDKKIPKQILSRCEWGRDDYSLKVENLPQAPPKPGQGALDFGEKEER